MECKSACLDDQTLAGRSGKRSTMKSGSGVLIVMLAGLAIALTACGRRGDLETPSSAAASKSEAAQAADTAPERSFVLDALIE